MSNQTAAAPENLPMEKIIVPCACPDCDQAMVLTPEIAHRVRVATGEIGEGGEIHAVEVLGWLLFWWDSKAQFAAVCFDDRARLAGARPTGRVIKFDHQEKAS